MIISREFLNEDIPGINDIFKKQPNSGIPSLRNMIVNSTLVDNETGKIVGYGAVKLFSEAILILDKEIKNKDKAQAVREAMRTAIAYSRNSSLEYIYAICEDERFSKVLRKSYGFKKVPGNVLILDLEGVK